MAVLLYSIDWCNNVSQSIASVLLVGVILRGLVLLCHMLLKIWFCQLRFSA